jgi:cytochrome b6-f complex iron-sulfur subunit
MTMAHPKNPPAGLSRRGFIQFSMAAVGAVWAGVFLQRRLFPSGGGASVQQPVQVALSELPVGGSRAITYAGKPALVMRTAESVKAFSLVCTHLACTVHWQPGERKFYCPCHEGFYDEFGEILSGPPPVPLEQIPVTINGSMIVVGEEA